MHVLTQMMKGYAETVLVALEVMKGALSAFVYKIQCYHGVHGEIMSTLSLVGFHCLCLPSLAACDTNSNVCINWRKL